MHEGAASEAGRVVRFNCRGILGNYRRGLLSLYSTVIKEQEEIIKAYSTMLHALLDELSQYRAVDMEEVQIKLLDEKGGING